MDYINKTPGTSASIITFHCHYSLANAIAKECIMSEWSRLLVFFVTKVCWDDPNGLLHEKSRHVTLKTG